MIRHARFGPTPPRVALTYPVRPPAGVRLMITEIGKPSLPLPRCSSTGRTAVVMPTIAMTADAKNSQATTTSVGLRERVRRALFLVSDTITTDDGGCGAFGTDDGVILTIGHRSESYVSR